MPEVGTEKPARTVGPMRARVLAVDDDDGVRQLVARMGERLGLRVELAADGREALTKFLATPEEFDLVLLDLTMPDVSGEEVFAGIREQRPHIPVVFMSGYTSADLLQRTGNLAGVLMLDKPFSMAAFERVISDAIGDAPAPAPSAAAG